MKNRDIKSTIKNGRGTLELDISHINKDWGTLLQVYDEDEYSPDADIRIITSNFYIFEKGIFKTTDLHKFPRIEKEQLWSELFELKRHYLQTVQPQTVKHTIDERFLESRFKRYKDSLMMPEYLVHKDDYNIWFDRK